MGRLPAIMITACLLPAMHGCGDTAQVAADAGINRSVVGHQEACVIDMRGDDRAEGCGRYVRDVETAKAQLRQAQGK